MDIGLEITPEVGIPLPLPSKEKFGDLRDRIEAACNTASLLKSQGADYGELTEADKEEAAEVVQAYAKGQTSARPVAKMTPEAVIYTKSILDEYGHRTAESATQIRHLVTTKLIQETENADPRIRMKALELLGKVSDVGLFTDKTEVTVTHQTSDELKSKLKSKLEKLINPPTTPHKTAPEAIEHNAELNGLMDVPIEAEFEEVSGDK